MQTTRMRAMAVVFLLCLGEALRSVGSATPTIDIAFIGACQPVRNIEQPETRVGTRITVEAATIHVVNCPGGQFYIYQYRNRQGFRVIRPPEWGNPIGGRDFQTFGEAMNVAAGAQGPAPQPQPQPPRPPGQTAINCHKYCMDTSGYSPAEYMPCTTIPANITGTQQQCAAIAAQVKAGKQPLACIPNGHPCGRPAECCSKNCAMDPNDPYSGMRCR